MRKFQQVVCLFLAACALTSCLKDETTEVTLSNDAAITSFTLGTLTQYKPGTTEVVATLTGSNYKMAIDQIGYRIFNRDSLPLGTSIKSVLCNVTTMNSGAVALQNLNDSLFQWHTSSSYVDFSQKPRKFRVFATDGSYYRDYIVTLNVSKAKSSDIWTQKCDTALLGGFTNMNIAALDSLLLVFGQKNDATQLCMSKNKGLTWTKVRSFADAKAWNSVVLKSDTLCTLTSNYLYFTTDGERWDSIPNAQKLRQLVGANSKEMFALTTDSIMMISTDTGKNWATDNIELGFSADSLKHLLGFSNARSVSFSYAPVHGADYTLLVGADKTKNVVWRKISVYDEHHASSKWVYIPVEDNNYYALPRQNRLSMVYSDKKVFAFGDNTTVYQSTDQGITWNSNSIYTLPTSMMAVTVDENDILWAVSSDGTTGKVWRGSRF